MLYWQHVIAQEGASMATTQLAGPRRGALETSLAHQQVGALDWLMALVSLWFVGGLCLDGWAHAHGRVDDTFFTPWHAVFYSGFGAVGLLLAVWVLRGILRGAAWHQTLPAGYNLALLGAPLFALSGIGDLAWHEVFGIERGVEALLSPTHLGLITSMTLIVAAPLRAAIGRPVRGVQLVPAVLSLALVLTLLTFISEYAHPFIEPMANEARGSSDGAKLGVAGVIIQSAILAGMLLTALRLPRLWPGAFTLVLGLNAVMISFLNDQFWTIGVAVLAGIAADVLYLVLRPAPARQAALRAFLAVVPGVLFLAYFLALMQIDMLVWRLHMWLGAVFLAAATGFLLAVVAGQASTTPTVDAP